MDLDILRRTNNRISTDKLLAEIFTSYFPKTKLNLKHKNENEKTSFSIQFTPKSIKIINDIMASDIFKTNRPFQENIFLYQQKEINVKAHVIRATTCNILNRLDYLKENPHIYQRAIRLDSSEKILEKIYQEKYKRNSS